jgi:tetratricopeptide (TPR) repeat protein
MAGHAASSSQFRDDAPEDSSWPFDWDDDGDFDAPSAVADRASQWTEITRLTALINSKFAELFLSSGNMLGAFSTALGAIRTAPKFGEPYITAGATLFLLQRVPEAEIVLRRAVALAPNDPMSHNWLGRVVEYLGRSEEAIEHHRRALELDPNCPTSWWHAGLALKNLGRFEEAAARFERVIELEPDFGEAHRDLADCRRQTRPTEDIEKMAAILNNLALPTSHRIAAGFGLGKSLDDVGRYDGAFAAYADANRLAREKAEAAGKRFEIDALRQYVDDIIATFTASFFASGPSSGVTSEAPIFVVGLYRSGTTLTEQILSSHPAVHGAGELFEISNLNRMLLPHPGAAASLDRLMLRDEALKHLAALDRKAGGAVRVVDKYPDNLFFLGLIAMLFPAARVIICRREVRDNVLSCYFQRFGDVMSYTTDLVDCAMRWRETERLAAHWRRVLPIRVLDMQYEELVANVEGQSRRMIRFIGLDWHPACLKFYETERTITTASAWQARQPIYTHSVGRWRNYRRQIAPLSTYLNAGDGAAQ